jgi:hypothetical protein
VIDGVHVIKKGLAISANLGIDHINPMIFFKSLLIMVFNNLKKAPSLQIFLNSTILQIKIQQLMSRNL